MVGAIDPVRGPHPIRASGQEKEPLGPWAEWWMVESDGAEVRSLVDGEARTSVPQHLAREVLLNLSLSTPRIRYVARCGGGGGCSDVHFGPILARF